MQYPKVFVPDIKYTIISPLHFFLATFENQLNTYVNLFIDYFTKPCNYCLSILYYLDNPHSFIVNLKVT